MAGFKVKKNFNAAYVFTQFFLCQNKKKRIVGIKNADTIALVYAEINIQIVNVIYKYGNRCLEKHRILRCLSTVLVNPSTC